jgi:hypothetical protein
MRLPYDVHQGAAIGRAGRLQISAPDEAIWTAGATHTLIDGALRETTDPTEHHASQRDSR